MFVPSVPSCSFEDQQKLHVWEAGKGGGTKPEPERDWTSLQFVQIKQANQIYHCKPRVGGDGPACSAVSRWRKPDGGSLQEPFTFHLFGARTTVAAAASRLICLAAAWLALPGPLHLLLLRMGLVFFKGI